MGGRGKAEGEKGGRKQSGEMHSSMKTIKQGKKRIVCFGARKMAPGLRASDILPDDSSSNSDTHMPAHHGL